jgi:hypothetical protein
MRAASGPVSAADAILPIQLSPAALLWLLFCAIRLVVQRRCETGEAGVGPVGGELAVGGDRLFGGG